MGGEYPSIPIAGADTDRRFLNLDSHRSFTLLRYTCPCTPNYGHHDRFILRRPIKTRDNKHPWPSGSACRLLASETFRPTFNERVRGSDSQHRVLPLRRPNLSYRRSVSGDPEGPQARSRPWSRCIVQHTWRYRYGRFRPQTARHAGG